MLSKKSFISKLSFILLFWQLTLTTWIVVAKIPTGILATTILSQIRA